MNMKRLMYRCYLYSLEALRIFVLIPLNAAFALLVRLWWRFSGVRDAIDRNKKDPAFYESSAQVLNCWGSIMFPISVKMLHFVVTHERFCHPSYVLRNDVTLMDVTAHEAIFVEQDPDWPPATETKHVSLAMGQIATARKIIVLPIASFLKLADELLRKKGLPEVIFVHNHIRCGGTMLCNMFEYTQRVICINEPDALSNVFDASANVASRDERDRMVGAVVAMLTKPTVDGSGETPLAYVIRPRGILSDHMAMFYSVFPNSTHLFLYRNPILSSKSVHRTASVFLSLTILKGLLALGNVRISEKIMCAFGPTKYPMHRNLTIRSLLESSFLQTVQWFLVFKDCVKEGKNITGVCYDDLCRHPDFVLNRIFQLSGLPRDLVSRAKRAMEHDAQGESIISRAWLAKVSGPAPDHSVGFLRSMEEMCREYGLDISGGWSKLRLPGSIVCPDSASTAKNFPVK